jgi:phenylacetate-CoA ligase
MAYGSNITKALYYAAPTVVKNLAATLYGLRERRARHGTEYRLALSFLSESQYWDNERLYEYQQQQVERFVTEALQSTPYYRNKQEYAQGRGLETFPILSKQEVRKHTAELCSDLVPKMRVRMGQTSGTTGTPLRFPISLQCFRREYAFRALHYLWGGVSLDRHERIAICAGHPAAFHARTTPPFWVHDHANNWLLMSSYHLSNANLPAYVKELERFQPLMISGYPSSIYLLAAAYARYGSKPLRLRSVFTGSETLYAYQRELIECAFGVKVFNWYGNSEMCANIVECEAGEMHLKLEHSAVEVLNENNDPCQPGETGRLVCTAFGNNGFPLLRYDVGDVVMFSTESRSRCGRGGVLIADVIGREEDYILTPDGRIVGRLDHIFKGMNNVVEAQIAQDAVQEIVIRIVKTVQFTSSDERRILREARTRLGDSIRVAIHYVEQIPREKNGKFRFIQSSLKQQEALRELLNS